MAAPSAALGPDNGSNNATRGGPDGAGGVGAIAVGGAGAGVADGAGCDGCGACRAAWVGAGACGGGEPPVMVLMAEHDTSANAERASHAAIQKRGRRVGAERRGTRNEIRNGKRVLPWQRGAGRRGYRGGHGK